MNCTPFVRQYGILFRKWGVFVCQRDNESPLTTIRAYTEALLEGVAPDEAARQRYLQTIYARETDLEALVNRLFELAKLGASEYPVHPEPLPLRQTVDAILADCDREGLTLDSTAVGGQHRNGRPRTAGAHFAQSHR